MNRSKHLYVWVAVLVSLCLLFGYGAFFLFKRSNDEPIDENHRIKVDPSFLRR